MQDRTRSVILNREIPLLESAMKAREMTAEQAAGLALLLQEQRRVILLLMNYSPLSGEALQARLQQVVVPTRSQIEATPGAQTSP